jgi:hypothetical protein
VIGALLSGVAGYVGMNTTSPGCALCVNGGVSIGDDTAVGDNNLNVVGDIVANSYSDRTPFYSGDALSEIKNIKGVDGKIDHKSLPEFVRTEKIYDVFEEIEKEIDGKIVIEKNKISEEVKEGRDIGAMVSVLTVAIQQLQIMVEAQALEIQALKN